jgi:Rps23 Pro-64 3,4-dihydroxylase Tpa1-like proline 4-hydroxylase
VTDLRCLESWLQRQHLTEETLEQYRSAFTAHPARLTVIRDFLAPHVAVKLNRFLESEAQFAPEFGLYSIDGATSEEEWLRADERDRFFRLRKLVSTAPQFKMSPNALTYLQFRKAFQRPEFKTFFEAISGLSLGWSDDFGAHSMIEGDFLRPHSDDNRNRRMALVIYLSQAWEPSFGGQLRVLHKDGIFTEIEPQYNSMIAFDVLTAPAHTVLPITRAAGARQRLSIGGWYHSVD